METEPKLTLRCKVVVVGDAGVGKTALTQVFKNGGGKYPKNYAMVRATCVPRAACPCAACPCARVLRCGGYGGGWLGPSPPAPAGQEVAGVGCRVSQGWVMWWCDGRGGERRGSRGEEVGQRRAGVEHLLRCCRRAAFCGGSAASPGPPMLLAAVAASPTSPPFRRDEPGRPFCADVDGRVHGQDGESVGEEHRSGAVHIRHSRAGNI